MSSRTAGDCIRQVFVAFCLALAGSDLTGMVGTETKPTVEHKDYDRMPFEAAKANVLDRSAERRLGALDELMRRNAKAAPEVLHALLGDPSRELRRRAAEYLAMIGDDRGLKAQAACLTSPECSDFNHHAARLLGNSGRKEYAPVLREQVEKLMGQGLAGSRWRLDSDDRALLKYATIGLARIGRSEDQDLVIEVVVKRPDGASDFLEALGYVNDPRSNDILWSAYRSMLRKPTCSQGGLGVSALVPLSRLDDSRAIELLRDVLRGIGTPEMEWLPGTRPGLCADREQAFFALRPRDAGRFAEAVFEVAAQDPEGPGTAEAWRALGVMRPLGFGRRVLELAMRKKPHWQLVTRDMLHHTVLAIDPALNDTFWLEYRVSPIPTYSGYKALIEMGLGYTLFPGSMYWSGD